MNKTIFTILSILLALAGGRWIANAQTFDIETKLLGSLMVLVAGIILGILFSLREDSPSKPLPDTATTD
jgi:hypothetical protein